MWRIASEWGIARNGNSRLEVIFGAMQHRLKFFEYQMWSFWSFQQLAGLGKFLPYKWSITTCEEQKNGLIFSSGILIMENK